MILRGWDTRFTQGAVSIRKTVLLGMAIPMLKIRRPTGRLIFNMGIPIPGKTVFYIETGPCFFCAHGLWIPTPLNPECCGQTWSITRALNTQQLTTWVGLLNQFRPLVVFFRSFITDKIPVTYFRSRSYWTGVTAAEHLSNMKVNQWTSTCFHKKKCLVGKLTNGVSTTPVARFTAWMA